MPLHWVSALLKVFELVQVTSFNEITSLDAGMSVMLPARRQRPGIGEFLLSPIFI
jgi:hypothetical protein